MPANDHGAVVQGSFGKEDPFDELRRDFRIQPYSSLQHLFGLISLREHDERADVVF